jgi:hypothetical protein
MSWRRQRLWRVALRQAVIPVRRENLKRLSALILNGPGLVQQRGIETFRSEIPFAHRLFYLSISRDNPRFVTAIPEDCIGGCLLGQQNQSVNCWPVSNSQFGTGFPKHFVKRKKRLVQPLSRCSARRPRRFLFRRINKDGHYGAASIHSGCERRVVRQPEIQSKPDDGLHSPRAVASLRQTFKLKRRTRCSLRRRLLGCSHHFSNEPVPRYWAARDQ